MRAQGELEIRILDMIEPVAAELGLDIVRVRVIGGDVPTLQIMAEQFSAAGVPVFCADVKGDLSGICVAGTPEGKSLEKINERVGQIGMDPIVYGAAPCMFWDLYGKKGHPIRATVSEMGPQLLSRLLQLNDTQEGVLTIAFRYADEHDMLLLDLEDLQAMLAWCADNADELSSKYGNVTKASVGSIQRQLLTLEAQGGDRLFGEPALDLDDLMRQDMTGRGVINILAADVLYQKPALYSTFLLWLLSELFERLPEAGDLDKPKLVFFFDEAHLLFTDAPKALLIRFATQPESARLHARTPRRSAPRSACRRAVSISRSASASVRAIGFSTKTFFPISSACTTGFTCSSSIVDTTTAPTSGLEITSRLSPDQ